MPPIAADGMHVTAGNDGALEVSAKKVKIEAFHARARQHTILPVAGSWRKQRWSV